MEIYYTAVLSGAVGAILGACIAPFAADFVQKRQTKRNRKFEAVLRVANIASQDANVLIKEAIEINKELTVLQLLGVSKDVLEQVKSLNTLFNEIRNISARRSLSSLAPAELNRLQKLSKQFKTGSDRLLLLLKEEV